MSNKRDVDTITLQWLWDLFDYLESGPEKTAFQLVSSAGALNFLEIIVIRTANLALGNLHFADYHNKRLNLPGNFVAIGDAVMRVNPVFG